MKWFTFCKAMVVQSQWKGIHSFCVASEGYWLLSGCSDFLPQCEPLFIYLFIIFCILSTWPCDMLVGQLGEAVSSAVPGMLVTWPKFVVWLVLKGLVPAAFQIAGANVIFFIMQDGKLKSIQSKSKRRVFLLLLSTFTTEFFFIMQLVCAWTCVCVRIWLSLWAQSKAACLETTKKRQQRKAIWTTTI